MESTTLTYSLGSGSRKSVGSSSSTRPMAKLQGYVVRGVTAAGRNLNSTLSSSNDHYHLQQQQSISSTSKRSILKLVRTTTTKGPRTTTTTTTTTADTTRLLSSSSSAGSSSSSWTTTVGLDPFNDGGSSSSSSSSSSSLGATAATMSTTDWSDLIGSNSTWTTNVGGGGNCSSGNGTNCGGGGGEFDSDGGGGLEAKDYWAMLLFLFPLLTVFGNVLVILSVYRERTLQTATNYFIISLAIADLLVATLVMPFAVYAMVNVAWDLPAVVCDFYIAMDVTCSTSSIFNLVAISIDRYIAVTQPIKYARHKNHKRVWLTIGLVWLISAAIGSPIVLGLNHTPSRDPTLCMFYNSDFVIYSSLSSFYIPCIIMVFLYYQIFKAIRERAKKAAAGRVHKPHGGGGGGHHQQQTATTTATAAASVAVPQQQQLPSTQLVMMTDFTATTTASKPNNGAGSTKRLQLAETALLNNSATTTTTAMPAAATAVVTAASATAAAPVAVLDQPQQQQQLANNSLLARASSKLSRSSQQSQPPSQQKNKRRQSMFHQVKHKNDQEDEEDDDDDDDEEEEEDKVTGSGSQDEEEDDDDDDDDEDDDDSWNKQTTTTKSSSKTMTKKKKKNKNPNSSIKAKVMGAKATSSSGAVAAMNNKKPSGGNETISKIALPAALIGSGGSTCFNNGDTPQPPSIPVAQQQQHPKAVAVGSTAAAVANQSKGLLGVGLNLLSSMDVVSVGAISATNTCEQSTTGEAADDQVATPPASNATITLPTAATATAAGVIVAGNSDSKEMKQSAGGSRFTIYKVNKASRKKREKSSAKKERKATKTLAIVLGVFLICWVPFFTCNIMDAICSKFDLTCQPGVTVFQLTTWLGYVNSFINPVIYTIFNLEFRKAFKRILVCER